MRGTSPVFVLLLVLSAAVTATLPGGYGAVGLLAAAATLLPLAVMALASGWAWRAQRVARPVVSRRARPRHG